MAHSIILTLDVPEFLPSGIACSDTLSYTMLEFRSAALLTSSYQLAVATLAPLRVQENNN
jgi:hypothetical protein